jgi:acyl-CoA thioesterase-2
MDEPHAPRESLAEILRIERRSDGRGAARLESFWGDATPGDLIARAILAAGRAPTALHASFLGETRPDVELSLDWEALTSEHTRVSVRDGGVRLAELSLRLDRARSGLGYQTALPEPGLPAPEDLPSEAEQAESEGWAAFAVGPIESRRITPAAPVKDHEPAVWLGWLRPRTTLAADPLLHAAALAFLSEYRSHWALERRLGAAFSRTEVRLLDHALWVHRSTPWNDWRLVRTSSEIAVNGRSLSRREIFERDGALVASAVFEAALTPSAR